MSNKLLVDNPTGIRTLLIIQNNGTEILGLSFDGPKLLVSDCPIVLQAGGSITFDQVVPQNRVYGTHNAGLSMPVGVIVGNMS